MKMDKTAKETLGARLSAVMTLSGMNRTKVGALCGVKPNVVSTWTNGQNWAPWEHMSTICEATGITLDWFYRGVSPGMDMAVMARLNALTNSNLLEARQSA
jgi:transcriptional regulator with XRE-family HTH domain